MLSNLRKFQFLLAVIVLAITGCQKEELLMSEDKIESQLENTWQRVEMTQTSYDIQWKFSDGKLYLYKKDVLLAEGNYSVNTSVTKVKIDVSGFPEPGYDYMNGNWQVVQLDDEVLVIAQKYHGGTYQQEFTRIDQ